MDEGRPADTMANSQTHVTHPNMYVVMYAYNVM